MACAPCINEMVTVRRAGSFGAHLSIHFQHSMCGVFTLRHPRRLSPPFPQESTAQLPYHANSSPGGRMASNESAPKLPRLEMVNVPLLNSSGASCFDRARFTCT